MTIKQNLRNYLINRTAKKHGRTFESEKSRIELAENLKAMRAKGPKGKEIARKTLEKEKQKERYLVSFLGKNRKGGNDLAKKLPIKTVVKNLKNFEMLDQEMALKIIEDKNNTETFFNNLDSFGKLDYKKLLQKMVENRDDKGLEMFFQKISGPFDKEFAKILIKGTKVWHERFDERDQELYKYPVEYTFGYIVVKNIRNFYESDHEEIAKSIIEYGNTDDIRTLLENINDFRVNHSEIVKLLLNKDKTYYIQYKVHKYIDIFLEKIDKFKGLNSEIAEELNNMGYGDVVLKNSKSFSF